MSAHPHYRLRHEVVRLTPKRGGLPAVIPRRGASEGKYNGFVVVEFDDGQTIAMRDVDIAAIRPDLAEEAAGVQRQADILTWHHYRWHEPA